jgi:hypothetical protein
MSNHLDSIDLAVLVNVSGGKGAESGIDIPPPGGGCFPPIDTTRVPSPFNPGTEPIRPTIPAST